MRRSKRQQGNLQKTFWRFAQYVVIEDECWRWEGGRSRQDHGYGQFRDETMKRVQAHRFSYEFFVGPIPKGLTLDHLCRNEACVNPTHVEPVTNQENCLRGSNPIPCAHGLRARSHCKACERARARARYHIESMPFVSRRNEKLVAATRHVVGASLTIPMITLIDEVAFQDRSNRSAIIRKALERFLNP